jgi:RNA polymerase sigma-32 factor
LTDAAIKGSQKALPADTEVDIPDLSLDMALSEDGGATHLDMLVDSTALNPELAIERRDDDERAAAIGSALSILSERERLVMEKRVMADEPESLQGLGDRFGLTRERVRQIEKAALEKLRKKISSDDLLVLN